MEGMIEEMRLDVETKNTHERSKNNPNPFRRPSCSASERTNGTAILGIFLVVMKRKERPRRRSKTHGAGLAGDIWAKDVKTNAHRELIRVSIRSPAKLESENSSAAVGVLSLSIGSQSMNRKRRLFDSRRNRAFSR
jgi:hypothetical protein